MVYSMANTAEYLLIDSFQLKIPPGASYVANRRTISYFTAGSNICQSGSCTKIIRINLYYAFIEAGCTVGLRADLYLLNGVYFYEFRF